MSPLPILHFAAGAAVPSWLLDLEPGPTADAGGCRGALTFAVDVEVVETPGRYIVAPVGWAPTVMVLEGARSATVFAPSKSVALTCSGQVYWGPDSRAHTAVAPDWIAALPRRPRPWWKRWLRRLAR